MQIDPNVSSKEAEESKSETSRSSVASHVGAFRELVFHPSFLWGEMEDELP